MKSVVNYVKYHLRAATYTSEKYLKQKLYQPKKSTKIALGKKDTNPKT